MICHVFFRMICHILGEARQGGPAARHISFRMICHVSHHGAVAFKHCGKVLFDVFRYLGVGDVSYSQPASLPYPTENPFA